MKRAALAAHSALSRMQSDMDASPVDGVAVVSRSDLEAVRDYIVFLEKQR
jgi:hypothetical protein